MATPPSQAQLKKIVADELTDIGRTRGGCYILMPPADSKLWRPGYHLLAKTRALGLADSRQDLFSLNRSINDNLRDLTPPDLAKIYKERAFAGVAREWFENYAARASLSLLSLELR